MAIIGRYVVCGALVLLLGACGMHRHELQDANLPVVLPGPEPVQEVVHTPIQGPLAPPIDPPPPKIEEPQIVPPAPPIKTGPPPQTIEQVNKLSVGRPGRNQGAVVRYLYQAGAIYEVYSAPDHPTTIMLPPGERLAAPPTLNPEHWDVGVAEMGEGDARQEAVIVRPTAPGLTATTPLLTQNNLAFFVRLKSLSTTSMVAVTWEGAPRPARREAALWPAVPPPAPRKAPAVDTAHVHTGYMVEVDGSPPWIPVSVYDDGRNTFLRFKASLQHVVAPAVFARHADGKPGLVEFAPYEVPNAPEKGAFYIVQGIWAQLELKGSDGQRVRLTRQAASGV